jgi:hypothetical protein
MIDVVCGGVEPVEFGSTVTIGQWVTSDAFGRAVPAYYGAIVVGVAVIVERGAKDAIRDAGLEYRSAYSLGDLGL